jgi:hypothetical protein
VAEERALIKSLSRVLAAGRASGHAYTMHLGPGSLSAGGVRLKIVRELIQGVRLSQSLL